MPNAPQQQNWFVPSLRDKFMLTGMVLGFLSYGFLQRHIHPAPPFLWLLTPVLMIAGAAIGELVKRRRARNT
jgi:hypothetical protein